MYHLMLALFGIFGTSPGTKVQQLQQIALSQAVRFSRLCGRSVVRSCGRFLVRPSFLWMRRTEEVFKVKGQMSRLLGLRLW